MGLIRTSMVGSLNISGKYDTHWNLLDKAIPFNLMYSDRKARANSVDADQRIWHLIH